MTRQVQGIILNKFDFRESDCLFVIYTDRFGKIEAVAKGAKKITSKMAGHLDFFSIINLLIAPGKIYYQIAGAETNKNFLDIKSSLIKTILGSCCLEVIDKFIKLDHSDVKIFSLLKEFLTVFNKCEKNNSLKLRNLLEFFILKFLSLSGWAPELFYCLKCKKKIEFNDKVFFNAVKGGLICSNCKDKNDFFISKDAIKILRFTLQKNFRDLKTLVTNKEQTEEIERIVNLFLVIRQDKELKSRNWLKYLSV